MIDEILCNFSTMAVTLRKEVFKIDVRPYAKQSTMFGKGHSYTDPKKREYVEKLTEEFRKQFLHKPQFTGILVNMITPIPGYLNYYADKDGNIYSRRISGLRKLKARLIHINKHKPEQRPNISYYASVKRDGRERRVRISVLVCLAYHGPKPANMECCHRNGDSLDNRAENVYWGTKSQNQIDSILHGTYSKAKLSVSDIEDIRKMISEGRKNTSIAELKDVSVATIRAIRRGDVWNFVT